MREITNSITSKNLPSSLTTFLPLAIMTQQRRLSRFGSSLFLLQRHQHPPFRWHHVVRRGAASDELKLPRSARDSWRAFHMQLFRGRSMSSKPYASSSLCKDYDDMSSSQPTYITFLTDVEGDGAYLDRFICHSKLLGFRSVTPSFGRYGKRRYGKPEHKCDGGTWNLGQYDEEYFPYDKEIVFLDDADGSGSRNSLLVYGVSLHHSACVCSIICIVFNRRTQCRT